MFKAKYVFALTGLLFSFASFNAISHASTLPCSTGDTGLNNRQIDKISYLGQEGEFTFMTQSYNDIFHINLKNYLNNYFEPIQIAAFLGKLPVHFCYYTDTNNKKWVDTLEIMSP